MKVIQTSSYRSMQKAAQNGNQPQQGFPFYEHEDIQRAESIYNQITDPSVAIEEVYETIGVEPYGWSIVQDNSSEGEFQPSETPYYAGHGEVRFRTNPNYGSAEPGGGAIMASYVWYPTWLASYFDPDQKIREMLAESPERVTESETVQRWYRESEPRNMIVNDAPTINFDVKGVQRVDDNYVQVFIEVELEGEWTGEYEPPGGY